MKTGKILLVALFIVAIAGGLMAFKAKYFVADQMMASITTTSVKSGAHLDVINAVNSVLTGKGEDNKGTKRFDEEFIYSGSFTSTAYTNPTNYFPSSGVTCTGAKVKVCRLIVYDANLIYPNDHPDVAKRGLPKVDQDPIKSAILNCVLNGVEKTTGNDFRVYLKP